MNLIIDSVFFFLAQILYISENYILLTFPFVSPTIFLCLFGMIRIRLGPQPEVYSMSTIIATLRLNARWDIVKKNGQRPTVNNQNLNMTPLIVYIFGFGYFYSSLFWELLDNGIMKICIRFHVRKKI